MAINWKKPIERRYDESWRRLHFLFEFIFLTLENSTINFNLYHKDKWGNLRIIDKKYDTCVLISLYILKLVANLTNLANPSRWETSKECTNEELLLVRYLAFNKKIDKYLIQSIPERRLWEIKAPEMCEFFYDQENVKKIKGNSFSSYFRTIPKDKIIECIWRLWYEIDGNKWRMRMDVRRCMYDFFDKFIRGVDVDLSDEYTPNLRTPNNFMYFFNKCGRSFEMAWLSFCNTYPDEVGQRMDEVWKKKPPKKMKWTDLKKAI